MTVAFYADENFPSPVIHAARKYGVDILTVIEDSRGGRSDEEVLLRATELHRVVLTHDHDFFEIVQRWQETSQSFSGVCFTKQQKLTYRELIEELIFVGQVGLPDDFRERLVTIPLRGFHNRYFHSLRKHIHDQAKQLPQTPQRRLAGCCRQGFSGRRAVY